MQESSSKVLAEAAGVKVSEQSRDLIATQFAGILCTQT
jgi:hypothetical protein